MAADAAFRAALRDVAAALAELSAPSMIIGGVAVIAAGVPRETIDIDATVLGSSSTIDDVMAAMDKHGILPRIDDAREFARERQVLLLQHEESGVTIDLIFGWLPFEAKALARAVGVNFEGVRVRVATAEDLIVYKAAAWRNRDRSDIERLLILHLDVIDLEEVRNLITEIGQALEDPKRIEAFDEIVGRARASRE